MKTPVVFLLLAAGLEAVLSEDKYFEIGGKLSLKPESQSVPKEGISAINWKHKGNFVAEWIKDAVDLSYFGDFNGRTDLDTNTGELTIRSMTKADEGVFSVEVNSKTQTAVYSARGITHLRDKKVEALVRPVACSFSSQNCNLSCIADVTDVGPVQYFWQQDEGQWKESKKDININNDDETQLIKTFSCKIKNPISEKNSEPLENPFMKKSEEQSDAGVIVGIILLVLLIIAGIALIVFAYKYPQRVAPCLRCVAGPPGESPDCGRNGASGRTQTYTVVSVNGTPTPEHNDSSVPVHLNTEADTKTSKKTPSEPDEISEKTPLKDDETPKKTPSELDEISEKTPLKDVETPKKTPSEPDESSEKTPLKDDETSNGTPEKS